MVPLKIQPEISTPQLSRVVVLPLFEPMKCHGGWKELLDGVDEYRGIPLHEIPSEANRQECLRIRPSQVSEDQQEKDNVTFQRYSTDQEPR